MVPHCLQNARPAVHPVAAGFLFAMNDTIAIRHWPMSTKATETIQLSTGTWIKIMGVLLLHTGILIWSAAMVVSSLRESIARLQTNQEILLDEYKRGRK